MKLSAPEQMGSLSGTPHVVRVLVAHAAKNGPVREAVASLDLF